MTLEEVRKEIDAIDQQLLPLFLKRMDCAKQVAEIKREQHLPVLNSNREQEILDNMAQHAGEYAGEARILYSNLMDMSRALQHNLLGSGAELRELVQKRRTCACARGAHRLSGGSAVLFPMKPSSTSIPVPSRSFFDNFCCDFCRCRRRPGRTSVCCRWKIPPPGSVSEVYDLILRYRFLHCGSGKRSTSITAWPPRRNARFPRSIWRIPIRSRWHNVPISSHNTASRPSPCSATAAAAAQKVAKERTPRYCGDLLGIRRTGIRPAHPGEGYPEQRKQLHPVHRHQPAYVLSQRGPIRSACAFPFPHRTGTPAQRFWRASPPPA